MPQTDIEWISKLIQIRAPLISSDIICLKSEKNFLSEVREIKISKFQLMERNFYNQLKGSDDGGDRKIQCQNDMSHNVIAISFTRLSQQITKLIRSRPFVA